MPPSINMQDERRLDAIRPTDIELAPTHTKSSIKKDVDPFLVAFDEPFDAENPRQDVLKSVDRYLSYTLQMLVTCKKVDGHRCHVCNRF